MELTRDVSSPERGIEVEVVILDRTALRRFRRSKPVDLDLLRELLDDLEWVSVRHLKRSKEWRSAGPDTWFRAAEALSAVSWLLVLLGSLALYLLLAGSGLGGRLSALWTGDLNLSEVRAEQLVRAVRWSAIISLVMACLAWVNVWRAYCQDLLARIRGR